MDATPEKTGPEQQNPLKAGKFPKGRSGNPKGRPKGARNKATLAAEALMDGDATAITEKLIQLAKSGDMTAIRLCMERILPPRKTRPLQISIPTIDQPEDVLKAVNSILSAVTTGNITTDEADALLRTVEGARKALETGELHRELDEMQKRLEMMGA